MSTETENENKNEDESRFFRFDVEIIGDKEEKEKRNDHQSVIKWSFNYKFALNEFSYNLNS